MVGKCRQAGRERVAAARKVGAPQVSSRNILLARRDAAARIPPRRASLGRTAGASRRKRTANSATALPGGARGEGARERGTAFAEPADTSANAEGYLERGKKRTCLQAPRMPSAWTNTAYHAPCLQAARSSGSTSEVCSNFFGQQYTRGTRQRAASRPKRRRAAGQKPRRRGGGVPEAAATKGGVHAPREARGGTPERSAHPPRASHHTRARPVGEGL